MLSSNADTVSLFAENLPGAAFYYSIDANGRNTIEFLNSWCETVFGISADEVGSDPRVLWQMVHPDDVAAMEASVWASAEDLTVWEARFRITDGAGIDKFLLSRGTPKPRPDGGTRWLTFVFDITSEILTEKLFERVSRQLIFISNAIPDAFAMFDPDEKLVVCNPLFREAYGLPTGKDLRGMRYADILRNATERMTLPQADGRAAEWIDASLANFRTATDRHEEAWADGRWMLVLDRPTEDGGRVAFRIETTEAVRRKQELEAAASTDPVTGLLNRRGLALELEQMRAALKTGMRLVVTHVDLDKFKSINDVHGHETGDHVLCEVARRLEQHAATEARIARVGGDEFAVVMATNATDTDAAAMAETLRNALLEPIPHRGRLCQIGATVGLAVWDPAGDTPLDQTLIDADTALMVGKSDGRNRTVLFTAEMGVRARTAASLSADIKAGLAERAFVPFFQPQVACPGEAVVGLEALARWRRADGSFGSADSFIEVARETGLVREIDQMILEQSLDFLSELDQAGLGHVELSLNLSALQLSRKDLVESLLDALLARQVSASRINIEVVESTLLDDRAQTIGQTIHALAEAGFKIELDDFGTGHTALNSLTTFPVHRIKIDRSLIRNIDADPKKRAITSGLLSVCGKLDIEALAEGVETAAELATLRELGFERFQGYHFAKPLPADAVLDWVQRRPKVA